MIEYTLKRQATFINHSDTRERKREGRYKRFLKVAYFVTRQTLPMYSHKKSPHIYSLPQLISCVLLKIYIRNMSFRDLEEFLLSSGKGKEIKRLFGKVLEVVISSRDLGLVFACDSTGFKEDVAGFYYALRSGKKRKRWIKVFYLLDTIQGHRF
ncbi:hypothetical protein HRbin37_01708 [bacterium HR37]|nr:hypothetical protein HRbin37_01708 [bacterium HR37]